MTSPGRPESATLQETLAVFGELGDPGTPLTTSEVAGELDCSRRTAFSKLEELADEGRIETKKVGARGRIWWRPVDVEVAEPSPGQEADSPDAGLESRLTAEVTEELLKTAPVAITVRDADGETLLANDRAQDLLAAADGEVVPFEQEHAEWAVLDADGSRLAPDETPTGRVLETGEPVYEHELIVEDPDGNQTWFSVSSAPVLDGTGAVEYVVTTRADITALKHQERRLERRIRDLEVELDVVLDRVSEAFYALDEDWRFTHVNDRAAEIIGHGSDELVGERLWDVFPDATGGVLEDSLREAMADQEPVSVEQHGESLDIWLEVNAYPSDTGISVYLRDVTERKRRERELERYETAIRIVNDGVYLTDADRRYTFVNDAYLDLMDMTREEVIGAHVSAVVGEEAAQSSWEVIQEMLAGDRDEGHAEGRHHGHSDRFVENSYALLPRADGEFAGTTGVVRDITERKRREWELERYQTLFETVDDGVYVLGPAFRFEEANDAYLEMTGYDEEALRGAHCSRVFEEGEAGRLDDMLAELAAGDRTQASLEADLVTESGDRFPAERKFSALRADDGEFEGAVGVVRDLSDREAYERNLRRYEKLIESSVEVNGIVDRSGTLEYVTPSAEYVLGYQPDDLVGTNVFELIHPDDREQAARGLGQLAAQDGDRTSVEFRIEHRDGSWVWLNARGRNLADDPMIDGLMVYTHDITDRKESEQELRQYETLIEESTDVNSVLDPDGTVRYITPSVEHVLGYDREDLVGENGFEYIHPDDREEARAEFARLVDDPDYRPTVEFRFRHTDGSWVVMEARGRNLLADPDIGGLVVYARDVTERKGYEEWLSSLNDLNELFQEMVEDLIETESQEAVERVVCERIVGSGLYEYAFVGRFDPDAETISPTTSAGLESAAEAGTDGDQSADIEGGPVLEAAKSGEPRVERDLLSRSNGATWQSLAADHGFASLAALPITYQGTFFGVLVIYSTRETAFEEPERAIISRFGQVIAHTISGIERKHALTTEDVVEVELRLEGLPHPIAASLGEDGRITLERAVPRDDGRFIGHGRATADAFDVLEALPAHSPEIESVSIYDETAADSRFEAVFGTASIVSTVAAENGRLDEAVLTSDGYRIAVHLPPSADTRRLVESVEELYPDVELVAQRRRKREGRSVEPSMGDALEDLTQRQRNALETAYSAGFFEWPRERNGEEVAETMDISSPTLHQHLRAAQRKLLGSVFADEQAG